MEFLTIIPARGGSKGIPHKNIMPCADKPLIAWTIEAALAAKHTHHVVVSTDDDVIAATARAYGAEVVMRPPELATDIASSESALVHALETWSAQHNRQPDGLLFLQCTSPLTLPVDIDAVIQKISHGGCDSAFSATPFHYFLWKNKAHQSVGINHNAARRLMRQQREPQFLETGAIYGMKTSGFLAHQYRFFGTIGMVEMPAERVLEIDDPADLERADFLLRKRAKHVTGLPKKVDAIVFDFDGVFTDNAVYVDEYGVESARCCRGDGMGIALLKQAGMRVLVLSSEMNPIVTHRCKKLGIECMFQCADKWATLQQWVTEENVDMESIVYVGNDINDAACIRWAGYGVAVANAIDSIKDAADLVLTRAGGKGAVREICELLLQSR